jgi:hypothetical protein
MEISKFAPVLICTLNRHVHFKNCITSLATCTHADKTDLFIGLDFPLEDKHWTGYKIIKAYLPNIKGFRTVNIIERKKNYGVNENFAKLREYVFEEYDRLIVSEDDNVFAPSFLNFVNTGLEVYRDRKDIFTITGYNSPFPMPIWYQKDAYLRTGFTGWGFGTWRDKWEKVDWTLNNFKSMLSTKETYKILKKDYQRYLPQLQGIRDTGHITGDGLLFLYMLRNNMYSIYPVKTRVRNTGHDGSGVNCEAGGVLYLNQQVYKGIEDPHLPAKLEVDKRLTKYVLKQIQLSFMDKIKIRIPDAFKVKIKKYLKK